MKVAEGALYFLKGTQAEIENGFMLPRLAWTFRPSGYSLEHDMILSAGEPVVGLGEQSGVGYAKVVTSKGVLWVRVMDLSRIYD